MALIWTDIWEAIADALGDEPAVIQGDRTVTWREYEDRAARLAAAFTAAGLQPDSKVGIFLQNCPEYLETHFATFKIRGVPINVNYRYLDDELWYLLDNADCEAVVFHSSLGDRIERIRDRLPKLKLLVQVDDGDPGGSGDDGDPGGSGDDGDPAGTDGPADGTWAGARRYDDVLAAHEPAPRIERSPDDIYMLYTGGTTGMPKGVMYGMGSFTGFFLNAISQQGGLPPFESVEQVVGVVEFLKGAGMIGRAMPCCPLMHGTGIWLGGMITHLTGGAVVLLESRHLDIDELWRTVERHGVKSLVIVGDAFARPMLRALDDRAATGSPYDISSLTQIVSSGAMFSTEVKEGLLAHKPDLVILDVLGSSEGGMGQQVSAGGAAGGTGTFQLSPGVKVFDENDRPVEPGSDIVGMVASTSSNVPLGYYKDPEKSARTFRTIDGVRYTFHGDMATVAADGTITLLGRGSHCINTGGEKVFPEEVEEAVKTHPAVHDCLIFGVDDERFGQRVVGVISVDAGAEVTPDEVIEHTRGRISHFKAPRALAVVETVPRAPNGKADYATARTLAALG